MKYFSLSLLTILLVGAGLSGCGKKKEPEVLVESSASETSPVTAGEPSSEPLPDAGGDADSVASGIPSGLLASDQAYAVWFKKYELDLNDPKMLESDQDEDGATNSEEFMADTNPLDPVSRPGIHKSLWLKEYKEVRVPLVLESVSGKTAKIRRVEEGATKSDSATSEPVEVGQTIGGLKVSKIAVKHETDKNGQPMDLSRVELTDPATKGKVVLVKDMPAKSASTFAILTAEDGTTLKVHQGETFQWPPENGVTFQVIDLRSEQAVVQEVATKQMWTIPMR